MLLDQLGRSIVMGMGMLKLVLFIVFASIFLAVPSLAGLHVVCNGNDMQAYVNTELAHYHRYPYPYGYCIKDFDMPVLYNDEFATNKMIEELCNSAFNLPAGTYIEFTNGYCMLCESATKKTTIFAMRAEGGTLSAIGASGFSSLRCKGNFDFGYGGVCLSYESDRVPAMPDTMEYPFPISPFPLTELLGSIISSIKAWLDSLINWTGNIFKLR